MARPLRIQYSGAWYHVTCRGNERREIYVDDRNRMRFVEQLRDSVLELGVELHCYVMMLNHFHLLVMTPLANLDRFMHRFNTAYTVYFNLRHKRAGHLYQGRYKALLIDADSYLLELSRYIHLNPVRSMDSPRVSADRKIRFLESYPWSSYPGYVRRNISVFFKRDKILGMFGVRDRYRRYRRFVLKGLREELPDPLEESRAGCVLGDRDFVEWVTDNYISDLTRGRAHSRLGELKAGWTVEEIASVVAGELKVEPEAIIKKNSRAGIVGRKFLIDLSCRYVGKTCRLKDIGRILGVSGAGLCQVRRRLAEELKYDSGLRRLYSIIEDKLQNHPLVKM